MEKTRTVNRVKINMCLFVSLSLMCFRNILCCCSLFYCPPLLLNCSKHLVTHLQNVTGYAAMLDSDSLEMNYQENPSGQMKFKTSGNDYMVDFQRMVQKNVVHRTERDVRRRPVFVNSEEIEIRKKRYFNHIKAYDYRGV